MNIHLSKSAFWVHVESEEEIWFLDAGDVVKLRIYEIDFWVGDSHWEGVELRVEDGGVGEG